jgi:hypothetical protein
MVPPVVCREPRSRLTAEIQFKLYFATGKISRRDKLPGVERLNADYERAFGMYRKMVPALAIA